MSRRALPLVFVASVEQPELDEADEHHLRKALRLRDGDAVGLSDGKGHWRQARLGSDAVEVDGEVTFESAPTEPLTVGFCPIKGERSEWFVQKLTELNVDRIIPLISDRGVVRWNEQRSAKLAARFRVTVREAAMQSRRVWLPTVEAPMSVGDALALPGAALADPDGRVATSADRTLFVGPEGGWSDNERAGADLICLPGAVLRAETAAIAAAVVLEGNRGKSK